MRTIKFRAWDKTRNRMCEDITTEFIVVYGNTLNKFFKSFPVKTGLVIMQYTGLKDKNEEEIYEGDIIKAPYSNLSKLKELKYIAGNWWIGNYKLPDFAKCDLEVIGNIYENPELL